MGSELEDFVQLLIPSDIECMGAKLTEIVLILPSSSRFTEPKAVAASHRADSAVNHMVQTRHSEKQGCVERKRIMEGNNMQEEAKKQIGRKTEGGVDLMWRKGPCIG